MKTKRIAFSLIIGMLAFAAGAASVFAQHETASGIEVEKNLDLIRRDLRAEKKKILAANVPLTADEATRFWPVYDEYAGEMSKHYDQFYAIIKDYAANQKTLTDDQANTMIKRWSEEQVAVAQTRHKYIPMIQKVIPGKKAALFFQIDRRLYAAMDLQVASEVPLVLQ